MLRKPAETTPSRPSIPSVRSVPSPTMRTERGAVEALLDPASSASPPRPSRSRQASKMNSVYSSSDMPASAAAASVGYSTSAQRTSSARARRLAGSPACWSSLRRSGSSSRAGVHVLGRADRQPCVLVLDLSTPRSSGSVAEQLERRLERPVEVGAEALRAPVDPRQVVGAAAGDRARDLPDERPGERRRAHRHLPARLHVEAPVDHQLGQLFDARVGHGAGS